MSARERMRWRVAAVQLTSTADVEANLERSRSLVRRAARDADLVALPENFAYLRPLRARSSYRTRLDGDLVASMADLARDLGRWLLLGSIPEEIPGSRRIHNTSVLLDPAGDLAAIYRKLHLFDARIAGAGSLSESRDVAPGAQVVVAATELGRLGLSICYDLRFPELYRRQALEGAEVLLVPSAFTAQTGLLAIPLIVFGGNYFVHLFELPPGGDTDGEKLLQSMRDGGLMHAIAASHVLIGLMLLLPRTRFAGALLQLPMSLGILAFHFTMLPAGLGPAVVMLILNVGILADGSRLGALLSGHLGSGKRS